MTKDEFLTGRPFFYQGNKKDGPYRYRNDLGLGPYLTLDGKFFCSITDIRYFHAKCVLHALGRTVRINLKYENLSPAIPELNLGGTS